MDISLKSDTRDIGREIIRHEIEEFVQDEMRRTKKLLSEYVVKHYPGTKSWPFKNGR